MAMVVNVKGRHLQVTDGLRVHAEMRLTKLDKYNVGIREATVVESVEGGGEHRVEVTLEGDGLLLRGEESTTDMYASLDRVVDKLEQRVKKFKAKHNHQRNHADTLRVNFPPNNAGLNPEEGVLPASSEEDLEDDTPQIVRTKEVTMKPMSVEDAVRMMELTDHDWFVYLDQDTNLTQVVYRRRDGNYGLVMPKI